VVQRPTRDRRIQKTDALLREALGALIREKPYHDIGVKEILGRANVGRSTFYTHFADKDELLLGCIHEMLGASPPPAAADGTACSPADLVWFSRPILEHIERHRGSGQVGMDPRGRQAVHEHLEEAIVELIQGPVEAAFRRRTRPAASPSPDLVARWIASTFVLVLDCWVDRHGVLTAHQADELFRALVVPSLAGLLQ
jgi:AcrR family transcriptional regulator